MDKVQIVDKTGSIVLFEAIASESFSVPVGGKIFPDSVRIYVGTGGDLEVKLLNDTDYVIFKNVPSGQVFMGNVKAIKDTNTDAEDLVIVG